MEDVTFKITGPETMHCTACTQRVDTALKRLSGVRQVHADVTTQEILIRFDPRTVSLQEIQSRLAQMGYAVEVRGAS